MYDAERGWERRPVQESSCRPPQPRDGRQQDAEHGQTGDHAEHQVRTGRERHRQSWFLLVVGLAGLLLIRESRQPTGALAGVDRTFLDWLAANAKPAGTAAAAALDEAPPVTLVEIDDSVIDTPGRWPLSALEYASFLQITQTYDPAVVAVEPVVAWPQAAPGTEQILLDQALTVSRLLLAVQLGSDAPAGRDSAAVAELPSVGEVSGATGKLAEFAELTAAPSARLGLVSAASGAINLPGDPASPVRDVPLLFRLRARVVPSFTLQALTLALRLSPREVSAVPGRSVQLGGRLTLPIDRAGRTLLDARAWRRVNRLGFDDLPLVAAGQAAPETRAAAERMRGGIVVLGRTDRGARTHHAPDGRALAPAEIFAWAVASLERDPPLRRASAWWDLAILAIFAAAGWWGTRLSTMTVFALAGIVLAVYALAALACFETSRLWLPAALPVGLTLVNVLLPFLLPARATS